MRIRLCVFVCSCLLALGLIGCSTPEESATTLSPAKTYGEVAKKSETKKEVLPLDNSIAVVPVRDPFMPLIVSSASGEGQTDKESGDSDTDNSEGTSSESNASQEITFELGAVYQQNDNIYASLKDGKQMADVTVGDTFSGYEVTKIDLQNNQVILKKDGQIVIIKNCSPTK